MKILKDMPTNSNKTDHPAMFSRTNYVLILMSCVTIVVGLVLMSGDGSTETLFQEDIFSVRRIVIAPMVCFAGYITIIAGIMWKKD
jgi:hypothetical protein